MCKKKNQCRFCRFCYNEDYCLARDDYIDSQDTTACDSFYEKDEEEQDREEEDSEEETEDE